MNNCCKELVAVQKNVYTVSTLSYDLQLQNQILVCHECGNEFGYTVNDPQETYSLIDTPEHMNREIDIGVNFDIPYHQRNERIAVLPISKMGSIILRHISYHRSLLFKHLGECEYGPKILHRHRPLMISCDTIYDGLIEFLKLVESEMP